MDFDLNDDQRQLVALLEKVGRERFRPHAFARRFDPDTLPRENLRLLGELGVLGLCMPESVGGGGQAYVNGLLALETITHACPMTGNYALMIITGPPMFVAKWGTDAQKRKHLPPALAGEESWAISLTEPQAGTDLGALKTSARIDGSRCLINGHKIFCSSAPLADKFLVFVRFGPGAKGIGAVIVGKDTPGFTVGAAHRHMCGEPWAELFFDDAQIPVDDVLFDGDGFSRLLSTYSLERCAAGIRTLAEARIAFDLAVDYAKERQQFGRPIAQFQMTQARLADMYMRYDAARLQVYRAAQAGDESPDARLHTSVAMVAATEAAAYVCEQAMNVFGGSGMSQDLPLEWLYRRVRAMWAAGGTSDIHRSMIAANLLGMRFDHRATADAPKGM